MKTIITALAIGALAIGPVAAVAAPVNARQANQERRIDAGQRSGKRTRAEAARLDAQQQEIKRLEDRLRARHGGKLTAADKRLIHMKQDQANRAILAQKNDRQKGKNKLPL